MLLAPPVFAFGKNKQQASKPVESQEVIHLDVTKNDGQNSPPIDNKNDNDWVQKDIIRDNVDTEFSIFDHLLDTDKDSEHPFKIEEESLFGGLIRGI